MRLIVIAVGRLKQGPERELAERYRKRFDEIGRKLGFRGLDIHEVPESRAREARARIAEEAAAIAALVPENSVLVTLDERGDNIDSAGLARQLGRLRDQLGRQHCFRHRRCGRTFARIAGQSKARTGVWDRDLAAPTGSRDASGAALPGCDDLGGPSLSPRLVPPIEVPDFTRCKTGFRDFRSKRGAQNHDLLVPITFRSPRKALQRWSADFGKWALVRWI